MHIETSARQQLSEDMKKSTSASCPLKQKKTMALKVSQFAPSQRTIMQDVQQFLSQHALMSPLVHQPQQATVSHIQALLMPRSSNATCLQSQVPQVLLQSNTICTSHNCANCSHLLMQRVHDMQHSCRHAALLHQHHGLPQVIICHFCRFLLIHKATGVCTNTSANLISLYFGSCSHV